MSGASANISLNAQTREMQRAADNPDAQAATMDRGLFDLGTRNADASGREVLQGPPSKRSKGKGTASTAAAHADTAEAEAEAVTDFLADRLAKLDKLDQLDSISAALTQALAENKLLREQLETVRQEQRSQAEWYNQQLAYMRASQFAVLAEVRAPQIAHIEKNIVLAPKPMRDSAVGTQNLVEFGKLSDAQIAQLLGVNPNQLHKVSKIRARDPQSDASGSAHSPVMRANDPCSRIEVQFKELKDKRYVMLAAQRRAIEAKACPIAGANCNVAVRDHLLGVELGEKTKLQDTAMQHLLDHQKNMHPDHPEKRARFSWRRSRITWWVPSPSGDGGAWALLSHLDVPPGSDKETVLRAAQLAEARAAAGAAAPTRSRRANGGTTQRGTAHGPTGSRGPAARS
jgi:hypothetical protein